MEIRSGSIRIIAQIDNFLDSSNRSEEISLYSSEIKKLSKDYKEALQIIKKRPLRNIPYSTGGETLYLCELHKKQD